MSVFIFLFFIMTKLPRLTKQTKILNICLIHVIWCLSTGNCRKYCHFDSVVDAELHLNFVFCFFSQNSVTSCHTELVKSMPVCVSEGSKEMGE